MGGYVIPLYEGDRHTPCLLSRKRQNEALQAWNPADQPAWLTSEYCISQIQLRLTQWTRPRIAEALSVSIVYAGGIRNGNCGPHPRHWLKLAELVGAVL